MKAVSLSDLGEYGKYSVLDHPAARYSDTHDRVWNAIREHRAGFSRMLDFAGVLVDVESARDLLEAGKFVVALGGEIDSFAAVQRMRIRESSELPTEDEQLSLAGEVKTPAWDPKERPAAVYLGSVSCGTPDYTEGIPAEAGYQVVYERFGTSDRPMQRKHFPGIDIALPVIQVERSDTAAA